MEKCWITKIVKIIWIIVTLLANIHSLHGLTSARYVCADGTFGWKCRFRCDCKWGDACDKVTGQCPNGCFERDNYGVGCLLKSQCLYDQVGLNYTGRAMTAGGKTCLRWDSDFVKGHGYTAEMFADTVFPENYCRNPMTERGTYKRLWCFTRTKGNVLWSYCNIKPCECPSGRYGESCLRECHCKNENEKCQSTTGACLQSGCAAGWMGQDCQTPCRSGRHGLSCQDSCGHCYAGTCDPETGLCAQHCAPGYYNGAFCDKPCPPGSYGRGCLQTCGKCRFGDPCNRETGNCISGCDAGWTGPRCDRTCSDKTWGQHCRELCGYCHNSEACDPHSGYCKRGCSAGYSEKLCHTPCLSGFYGVNCTYQCGYCADREPCDRYTGKCLVGCATGYYGDLCRLAANQTPAVATAGGVGAVAVLILVVVIIAVLMWRKKRTRKDMYPIEVEEELPSDMSKETDTLLSVKKLMDTSEQNGSPKSGIHDSYEEPIYVNVNTKKQSSPVPVAELYDYIQRHKEGNNAGFKLEYEQLPSGLLAVCDAARAPENKPKNRYGNIVAYDHSRVVLAPLRNIPYSDYVNANYIDGYRTTKAYIASQGPNKVMLPDFWRMVWQHDICKLVMLTNLVETCRKKCELYWPEDGTETYGDVEVELKSTVVYTDYTMRIFSISQNGCTRSVKHFHFTTWSDHGAPTYPTALLAFLRKVNNYSGETSGPVLTHCSAGIGRTGTYIALDYLLQQAREENMVDVLACAQLMRTNRINMIQTLEHMFVYDALLEAITAGPTTISCPDFPEAYSKLNSPSDDAENTAISRLEQQYKVLQLLSPVLEREECKAALVPENLSKNRCRNILPANRCRPYLYTPVDGCNDYINAIFLPVSTAWDLTPSTHGFQCRSASNLLNGSEICQHIVAAGL